MEENSKRHGIRIWSLTVSRNLCAVEFSAREHHTVLGFDDGEIRCLDAFGKLQWKKNIGASIVQVKLNDKAGRVAVLDDQGRFWGFDLQGRQIFEKRYGGKYSFFEMTDNGFYLADWRSPLLHLDLSARKKGEIKIPVPIVRLRAFANGKGFFVVHNSLSVCVYDSGGNNQWCGNNPAPIEYSDSIHSDVSASDDGRSVAIGCFGQGVYLYDAWKQTLKNIELGCSVTRLAVSGDGRMMLLCDGFANVHLVTRDVETLWQTELGSQVLFCRLNEDGSRAILLIDQGELLGYRFFKESEDREQFFELNAVSENLQQKTVWVHRCGFSEAPRNITLQLSADGRMCLHGVGNDYSLINAQGQGVWKKSFLIAFDGVWVSPREQNVYLFNDKVIHCVQLSTGEENRLAFYDVGLREVAFDPGGQGFLVYKKNGSLSFYDAGGEKVWRRSIRQEVRNIMLDCERNLAILNGPGNSMYFLDLTTFRAEKTLLEEAFSVVCLNGSRVYVGAEDGTCYGLSLAGEVLWKKTLDRKIQRIFGLKNRVAVRLAGGEAVVLNEDGEVMGEGTLANSRSVLYDPGEGEILQISPQKHAIVCRELLGGGTVWRLNVDAETPILSVSEWGNRWVMQNRGELCAYEVTPGQGGSQDDRIAFLEF